MPPTPPTKQTFDDNGNPTRDVVFDGPTHTFQGRTSPALKELTEELGRIYWKACTGSVLPLAERIQYQKEIELLFTKTYAAGVKAGLMEAREGAFEYIAPTCGCSKKDKCSDCFDEEYKKGWNEATDMSLARLDEKINSLK